MARPRIPRTPEYLALVAKRKKENQRARRAAVIAKNGKPKTGGPKVPRTPEYLKKVREQNAKNSRKRRARLRRELGDQAYRDQENKKARQYRERTGWHRKYYALQLAKRGEEFREYRIVQNQKYKEKHRTELAAKSRVYYLANREKACQKSHEYGRRWIAGLANGYLQKLIRMQTPLKNIPSWLLEYKRMEINAKRTLRRQKEHSEV